MYEKPPSDRGWNIFYTEGDNCTTLLTSPNKIDHLTKSPHSSLRPRLIEVYDCKLVSFISLSTFDFKVLKKSFTWIVTSIKVFKRQANKRDV